jgi:hypothetical protein
MPNNVFPKIVSFVKYSEKNVRGSQSTDDNIVRRMHFACWVTKATEHTHNIQYSLYGKIGYANGPRCYVCTTLPV